jgi:uncharacterized protein (TIGR02246 family)
MSLSPEDRQQVVELYSRNAWAFDTGDLDGFVGTFTPDAALDLAKRHDGQAAIRAFAELAFKNDPWLPRSQQLVSQIIIDGEGDQATVRAYVTRTHRLPGRIRSNCMVVWTGYTTDRVIKSGGAWLFQEKVTRAWEGQIVQKLVEARE